MNIKINISWPMHGSTSSECVTLNQRIDDVASSAVVFGGSGRNSSPHVTIAMGMVEDMKAVSHVAELLKDMLKGVNEASFYFGPAHRDSQTGRYVVCEVSMPDAWLQFRKVLKERCDRDVFVESARTSDRPHLTVAHVTSHLVEVDALLESSPKLSPCDVHTVDIALAGAKGARGDVLHSIKFASHG